MEFGIETYSDGKIEIIDPGVSRGERGKERESHSSRLLGEAAEKEAQGKKPSQGAKSKFQSCLILRNRVGVPRPRTKGPPRSHQRLQGKPPKRTLGRQNRLLLREDLYRQGVTGRRQETPNRTLL